MNLQDLKNKDILLFGKSRAFSADEFASCVSFHNISIVKEFGKNVALVVEGKMITPYEQNALDVLYKEHSKTLEFISIDIFEKELAKHIDSNTLLMSLKLSRNKERLKSFIQNSMIDDELFFKLLKMYSWVGEDFFENDDNRDVSAAIILRFYKNIERNHNVQYATSGLMHLIAQSDNQTLIEAISMLEPLQKSLREDTNGANRNILLAIATHVKTPKSVLNFFIKKADTKIRTFIALRNDCDCEMQKALYSSLDESVLEALSSSKYICPEVLEKLLEIDTCAKKLAKNIMLDSELFERFLPMHAVELAKNSSLSLNMQERMLALNINEVNLSLAQNSSLFGEIALKLLLCGSSEVTCEVYKNSSTPLNALKEAYEESLNHLSLAQNSNTPAEILSKLSQSLDIDVLRELAKNVNTPIDVLYQLQLDSRVAREVKENPTFGKYIQVENIGWDI